VLRILHRFSICCVLLHGTLSALTGCDAAQHVVNICSLLVQQVKSDSKPAGNSLNGKYNVPRPRAAGKSGTVNRYAVGRAAGAKKSSAQPMRRTIANPRPSQRQQARRATDSNRCSRAPETQELPVTTGPACAPLTRGNPVLPGCRASSVEPLVDDDTFWLDNLYNAWQFDNLYNPWRDEDADRSERRPDTDDCNDGRWAAW
jgi:hypothetical protein